eukprot:SAG31_NODE_20047_length_585_cov_0.845679_1_plen_167_part_00
MLLVNTMVAAGGPPAPCADNGRARRSAPPRLFYQLTHRTAVLLIIMAASQQQHLRLACALQLVVPSISPAGQQRLAIERDNQTVRLMPSAGEPPFPAGTTRCLLNRNDGDHGGGFKLTLPPWTRGDMNFMSGAEWAENIEIKINCRGTVDLADQISLKSLHGVKVK